jgi:hypothetical protein
MWPVYTINISQNYTCPGYIVAPWTYTKVYFCKLFKHREDSLAERIVIKTGFNFECKDSLYD